MIAQYQLLTARGLAQTLYVNLPSCVFPVKINKDHCSYRHLPSEFSSKLESSTIMFRYIIVRMHNIPHLHVNFILLWGNFLWRACYLVQYWSLFWILGETFESSSFHLSNFRWRRVGISYAASYVLLVPQHGFEKTLGSKIGYVHGAHRLKSRINLCKARLAHPF
jgi:hypothetical protein